jgi:hypothetical protein
MAVSNSFRISFQFVCAREEKGKIKLSLFLILINNGVYPLPHRKKIFEKELDFCFSLP